MTDYWSKVVVCTRRSLSESVVKKKGGHGGTSGIRGRATSPRDVIFMQEYFES